MQDTNRSFVYSKVFDALINMKRGIRIWSYFSIETDLAAEMHAWPEFVTGKDYDVELRNSETGEAVSVRYFEQAEDAEVIITGTGSGSLFDRVVGCAVHAMSAHSDYLQIRRADNAE